MQWHQLDHMQSAPHSNSSSLNCFTNRMLFLMPNQQCQSMEGSCSCNYLTILRPKTELNIHSHTRLTALCPGVPGWAGTRKVKPIWILLKQETVSSSGISWAVCKCAPRSRQITMPAPHHSVFLQAGCPSCRPTNSVKGIRPVKKLSGGVLAWCRLAYRAQHTECIYKQVAVSQWPSG